MAAEILRYPLDIIDATTDYMSIEVLEYQPGGLPSFADPRGANTKLKAAKANFTIFLPMPDSIASVNRTGWGESRLSALAGAGLKLAGGALNAVSGGKNDLMGSIQSEVEGLAGSGSGYDLLRNYIRARSQIGIINGLTGANISLNDVLGRQSGQIVNQNVELLFNGVSLRPFGFNWDLVPRSKEEADKVKEIIQALKKSMSANRENSAFLKAPYVFRLRYKKGGVPNEFLNSFKICAMTDIGVDYTGSGAYATYENGSPVHYRLNLSFTELEPVYADDFDKENF
jgi:hypothetical protein